MIHLKRVYDDVLRSDGARFLVERLWPRGISKSALRLDGWLKEVGPSPRLRQWFAHDPAKWNEFQRRYFAELNANPAAWEPIIEAAQKGTVTLVFSSRDAEHNNAVALKSYLEDKLRRSARRKHRPAA